MSKLITTLAFGTALGVAYAVIRAGLANAAESKGEPHERTKTQPSEPAEKSPNKPNAENLKPVKPAPLAPVTAEPLAPAVPDSRPAAPSSVVAAPIPEPKHPTPRQRINFSKTDEAKTVIQSPKELLKQARRYDPDVTLDELTGARLAASEHGSGSFTELCCIVDAEVNRAKRKGKSLYQSLTYKDTFGKQGRTRRASTRRDPRMRHLLAARAVLSGKARGISRGAVRFYDPKAQLNAHRRWKSGKSDRRHCHPLVILERWAFDYPWAKGKKACTLNRKRSGRHKLQWVGPIPSVDPFRLLLMRPATEDHQKLYELTRDMLKQRFAKA